MIDREKIEQRLALLRKDLEQMQANVQAYGGAIQECEYWLSQLDSPQPEQETK